ncbi:MAG: hypothetical protein LBD88_01360 [Candidatus Peribacteria bacterium]|nr:hypothetical protein [Candidatus Peribacteria bacterium]
MLPLIVKLVVPKVTKLVQSLSVNPYPVKEWIPSPMEGQALLVSQAVTVFVVES